MRIIILTAFLLGTTAFVQTPSGSRPLALGTRDAVILRFPVLDTGLPQGGFVVTRSGSGAERTFTVRPLNAADAAARFRVDADDFALLTNGLAALRTTSSEQRGYLLLTLLGSVLQPNLARAAGLLYDDTNLAAGTYTYTVTADGRTLGRVTARVGQDSPLPAPPQPKATFGRGSVRLTWTRGGEEVVGYRVQRSVDGGAFVEATSSLIVVSRGVTPAFDEARLDAAKTYRYRVTAVDVFGRESAASPVLAVEGADTVPLAAPVLRFVRGEQGRVMVSWQPLTDRRVREVVVLRGDKPGKLSVLARVPAGSTSYTDAAASLTRPQYYAVKASDGSRESSASPDLPAQAFNTNPPAAPANVRATGQADGVALAWTPSREDDVVGYRVYRTQIGVETPAPPTLLNGALVKEAAFKDTIAKGVRASFEYTVRAVNASGVEGAPSTPVRSRTADGTPPDAPIVLRIDAVPGKIALVFTQTPTPDLRGFDVYRAAEDDARASRIATLPPDAYGFVDPSVNGGTTYSYAVRAVDDRGNASEPSNVVSITPPAARLAAPANVRAANASGALTLTWNAVEGAVAYFVYRETNGRRVQLPDLVVGTTFREAFARGARYLVQAVDREGRTGPLSSPAAP
ncbi:fibronectin type III domain-containing protein [Deinococcus yavapaiensis]|uniref:Fibronectin type-III domain-containing protein n=1 Tax=Deinococcus yavapaiensis KR-236 TaxID=694435 RepID=A0A318SKH6_9DEIO|nr:hypothetical protein [Deinococcus yavapaiensis]PYE54859.1 hypothetical protein DES52_104130 [Deinococcus yavapaiensis KR-236]